MIRRSTLLWLIAAVLAGCGLYQLKYEVQAKEELLARLNRQIQAEQEAIHVLNAEWAFLNRPDRLGELAGRHLEMTPVEPAQFGRVAAIPERPLIAVAAAEPQPPAAVPPAAPTVKVAAKPSPATPKAQVVDARRSLGTVENSARLRAAKGLPRDVVVVVDGALLVNARR